MAMTIRPSLGTTSLGTIAKEVIGCGYITMPHNGIEKH
jgi:hypothetical protein